MMADMSLQSPVALTDPSIWSSLYAGGGQRNSATVKAVKRSRSNWPRSTGFVACGSTAIRLAQELFMILL